MPYVKLSISISEELLQKADAARKALGESRSGLIQRLLIRWLQESVLRSMETKPPTNTKKGRKPKRDQ